MIILSGFSLAIISNAQNLEWDLSDENVGIGIGDPKSKLHVYGQSATKIIVENADDNLVNDQVMFQLKNAGNSKVRFAITSNSSNTWTFDNDPSLNSFAISKVGTGLNELSISSNGDATLRGRSYAMNHINVSSRDAKTNFAHIDEADVLLRLSSLPIFQWRYKAESDSERHIGPTAEDFRSSFSLGDGITISTVDATGVAFAAIKGLLGKIESKEEEIALLERKLSAQEQRISRLESLINNHSLAYEASGFE